MKNRLFISCFIIVGIFFKCSNNQSNKPKSLEKVEKYANGRTKVELWNFDTVRVLMKYNKEGMLIDSIPYNQDTLVHGVRKKFYNDERTKNYAYINYVNDVGQGKTTAYYLSGELYVKGNYYDGQKIKDWFFYYKSGELLSYKYYDYYGKLVFNRMYDNKGKITRDEGKGIGYFEFKSDTVKIGEKFTCRVNVATPPNGKVKVFVSEKVTKQNDPILNEFYEYTLENGTYTYSSVFNKKGIYKKGFGWSFTDSISNKTITDFKVMEIVVIND